MNIDLHCHSTHSDGTWSVEAILKDAEDKNVEVLSITDHDNLGGSLEAFEIQDGIFSGKLIAGIEISTEVEGEKIHLLAFFPSIDLDPEHELLENLDKIKNDRVRRMKKMIENANELGFEVTFDEVLQIAGTGIQGDAQPTDVLSRPHLARLLIEKGYVRDFDEAFDKYLADGQPIHEYRFSLDFTSWIEQVRDLNGLIIWAHPLHLKGEDKSKMKKIGKIIADAEIDGVERIYNYKGKYKVTSQFEEWGNQFLDELIVANNWLITSGGDFHGDVGILGKLDLPTENWKQFSKKLFGQ